MDIPWENPQAEEKATTPAENEESLSVLLFSELLYQISQYCTPAILHLLILGKTIHH